MMGSTNRAGSWLNFAQRSRDEGGLGLAPHQAAGLVGNLVNESGQDLNPWGPTGDNGTAWGTAQWRNDRLARLKQRPDYQTMEGQQAFMREELDSSENKAYRALQAATTPEEAAHAWDAHYERSDGSTREQRMRSARSLMDQFGGGSSDPSPGALTSSFAPTESKSMPALSADNTMGPGVLGSDYQDDPWARGLIGMGASLASITSPEQGKALAAQAASMQKAAVDRGTWTMHVLPDGRVVRINSKSGVPEVLGSAAKAEKNTYQEAYDTGDAADGIKLNAKLSDAAASAASNATDFAMLDKALKNPNVGQGLAGPARNFMNKAYVAMGIGDANTAAAASDADILNSLGPKMALQVVQNGGDKLLPGSMSDSDLKLVTRFGNGDKLEPAANRQLLEAAMRHNARVMEAETLRQQTVAANEGRLPQGFRNDLGKLRQKWAAEDTARESAAAPAQPSAQTNTNSFTSKSGKTINWSY